MLFLFHYNSHIISIMYKYITIKQLINQKFIPLNVQESLLILVMYYFVSNTQFHIFASCSFKEMNLF